MDASDLARLLHGGESSTVEFKRHTGGTEQIAQVAKEIAALLNYQGGYILLGVEDKGSVSGLMHEPRAVGEWVMNVARGHVWPAPSLEWDAIEWEGGKTVGVISLPKDAPDKPYQVKQGSIRMTPMRAGTTTSQASREEEGRLWRTEQALRHYPVEHAQRGERHPSLQPSITGPLIGRDAELARLRAEDGDIVLVGKPGVGKTFLLEHLADEGWCVFNLGGSISELLGTVIEAGSRRVVLDDAHLSLDRIATVRRLRRKAEANFRIVAVSWPGRAAEVEALLPDAKRIDIEELERDRIVEVIEAAGVAGPPDLQRMIVDQADGRAGLAAVLARACMTGRVREVATGEVLLADLAGCYGRILGAKSRHVLGVLALAGDGGATTEQVGSALRLDLAETSDLMRTLSFDGTLAEAAGRRMNVQPASWRYPLVHDVFYGPGSLDPRLIATAFDDPSAAALPLIGAAHCGASVDREWLRELIDWRDEQASVEYASLGPGELREALERAPEAWAEAASDLWGRDAGEAMEWAADRRAAIAGAAYRRGVDSEYALRVLMETAAEIESSGMTIVGGTPLDIVRQHLARLENIEARLDERRAAAGVASRWLREGGDAHAGVRVLAHAVQPELSDVSTDPGLGRALTLTSAIVPPWWIEPLAGIWDVILDAAERRPDIPIGPIAEALEPWARPGTLRDSRPGKRCDLPEEAAEAMRETAVRVIERLAGIFRERPGALHRLRVLARRAEMAVHIDLPDDFAALYRVRDPLGAIGSVAEMDEWERRGIEEADRVADALAERPIAESAHRLVFLASEADEAGIAWPPGARRLAQALAKRSEEPETLLDALIGAGASGDVLEAPLDRAADLQRPGWEAALDRLLGSEATAGAAIRTAIVRPVGERLKRLAIREAASWRNLIEILVVRDEIDDATLALLFDAPDPPIARAAALALAAGGADGSERLPPALRDRWREIVVSVPPDGEGGGGSGAWRLARILEGDHDLCARWLRARFASLRDRESGEQHFVDGEVAGVIADLPPEIRTGLIADVPAGVDPFLLRGYVESLLSGNIDATKALFGRADLGEGVHALALQRIPSENPLRDARPPVQGAPFPQAGPARPDRSQAQVEDATAPGPASPEDEAWMERALIARDHGWEPERIVDARLMPSGVFWGNASTHWQGEIEAFERLRSAPDQRDAERRGRIADAGVAFCAARRDDDLRREREERVHGPR